MSTGFQDRFDAFLENQRVEAALRAATSLNELETALCLAEEVGCKHLVPHSAATFSELKAAFGLATYDEFIRMRNVAAEARQSVLAAVISFSEAKIAEARERLAGYEAEKVRRLQEFEASRRKQVGELENTLWRLEQERTAIENEVKAIHPAWGCLVYVIAVPVFNVLFQVLAYLAGVRRLEFAAILGMVAALASPFVVIPLLNGARQRAVADRKALVEERAGPLRRKRDVEVDKAKDDMLKMQVRLNDELRDKEVAAQRDIEKFRAFNAEAQRQMSKRDFCGTGTTQSAAGI